MKLLVDNQLPVALARHLTSLGHDCEHVEAVHLDAASDAQIWEYASQRLLLVTQLLGGHARLDPVHRLVCASYDYCRLICPVIFDHF